MGATNFKIIFKQLLRNKWYSIVTLFGFSVSLMFVILLTLYVKQELSVDNFHENKDRIFRLVTEKNGDFAPPVGERLAGLYPEVESYTRLGDYSDVITNSKEKKIRFTGLMVDPSFFTMFSFNLIEGNPGEALAAKSSIVLSGPFAKKLFPGLSPMGKEVEISKKSFTVTGVLDDFPENTHFQATDVFINFTVLSDFYGYPELLTTYNSSSYGLYFLLKPGTNLQIKAHEIVEMFKKEYWIFTDGRVRKLRFEPLTDIYLGGIWSNGVKLNSKRFIIILSVIAILILILSIINYINLTIAQLSLRNKEVAVKKLLGSPRYKLVLQFVMESFLLCMLAFIIAIVLSEVSKPTFNNLLDTNLDLYGMFTINSLMLFVSMIMVVAILSGLFPALVINKYKAINLAKGAFKKAKNDFSRALIAFQYCAAIVLVICTCMVAKQTVYLKNYDVGFARDNIIWINNDHLERQKLEHFGEEIKKIAGVENVSYVSGSPIDGGNNQSFTYNDMPVSFQEFLIDSVFFSMVGIKVKLTGIAYSKDAIWLNNTAVKELGLDSLPTEVKYYDTKFPVLGIVDDFHFRNLHEKVGPAIIRQLPEDYYPWKVFVKLSSKNMIETVDQIKSVYSENTGGTPMEYGFVDDTISQWYQKEEKEMKIIGYFTVLAIIISLMGLMAMAVFYIEQKIKEIAIRRVNGAKGPEIIRMLTYDLLKWVTIAFIIACLIAYYAMHKWLQNFAYKTEMSWWIFALAGGIALAIALLTVSWQSWRAARRNPVECLRYE